MSKSKADAPRKQNALGEYVWKTKGDRSLNDVAARGGIDSIRLGRWLRNDLKRTPPNDVLDAIARGLGQEMWVVQRVAEYAARGNVQHPASDELQQLMPLFESLSVSWKRFILSHVRMLVNELHATESDADNDPDT